MSKLDEKLAASVKPAARKTPVAKPTATEAAPAKLAAPKPAPETPAKPTPRAASAPVKKAVANSAAPRSKQSTATDLNAANPPLFPASIWPD